MNKITKLKKIFFGSISLCFILLSISFDKSISKDNRSIRIYGMNDGNSEMNPCFIMGAKIEGNKILIDTCYHTKEQLLSIELEQRQKLIAIEDNKKMEIDLIKSLDLFPTIRSLRTIKKAKLRTIEKEGRHPSCDYTFGLNVEFIEEGKREIFVFRELGNCKWKFELFINSLKNEFNKLK